MYHFRATMATTNRILRQLSHDPRTIAMIFVVPCVLMSLLYWLFSEQKESFARLAPALLGIFPFVIMFIITSITMLRERTEGTLERLMVLPIGKLDLIVGYMGAFGLLAIIQSLLVSGLVLYVFDLSIAGPQWFLVVMALANAVLGAALGLFVSAFARTEFQAVQFMPALILPQALISGLLMPLSQMPELLEKIAYVLPLTYAIDALNIVAVSSTLTDNAWRDLIVVVAFALGALLLGAVTLRRQTK